MTASSRACFGTLPPLAVVSILLAVVFLSCSAPAPPELVAVPLPTVPLIDGMAESLWQNAPSVTVPLQGGEAGSFDVQLRAGYTETHLYLLCRWPDSTESMGKERWEFDGVSWTQRMDLDEDRFALLFPIGNARARFEREGCQRYCHDDFMATKLPEEQADVWHWKSVRTNPVHQADDKYWVYATTTANEGGRRGDAREIKQIRIGDQTVEASHYIQNINAAEAQPAFMHRKLVQARTQQFLKPEDAVPFGPEAGLTTVPGYLVGPHLGSRGDIEAYGRHVSEGWVLEIGRRLDTGHEDDIAFDLSKRYPFGLAVMDNARGDKHSWSKRPGVLVFQPRTETQDRDY